jgi:hypothetical protein
MEDGSFVPCGKLAKYLVPRYSVTYNLTNCVSSNNENIAYGNGGYSTTITENKGFAQPSVSVKMNGIDVTTSAVNGGNISIANVTGDIIITAVAGELKGNLADPTSADWQEGYRLSVSSGSTSALVGHTTTNYIPCKGGDILRVKGLNITGYIGGSGDSKYSAKILSYTSDKTKILGLYAVGSGLTQMYGTKVTTDGDVSTYTLMYSDDGAQNARNETAYIRIDGGLMNGYTANDVVITINEEIV